MLPIFDNNKTSHPPVVTRLLIWLNVIALVVTYWYESSGVSWVTAAYGLVPARLALDPTFESVKILTGMFLHGGFWHLVWNLWFLHLFGDNVEDVLGRTRFLAFYLLSGVAAALTQFAMNPASQIPMVGASGAIAGVLGAYLVLFPRVAVSIVNPIFPLWFFLGPFFAVPAWLVFGEWFLGNLVGGLKNLDALGSDSGGVAFFAHLGGFVFGLLTIRAFVASRGKKANLPGRRDRSPLPGRKIFWKEDSGPFWK